MKGHGLYLYPVVLETVDFPVGWVFIVFAHTHAGSCKLCGVDMPSIVNSLIHHSSQRLHIESSSSGFLLDWNKRGHWHNEEATVGDLAPLQYIRQFGVPLYTGRLGASLFG